MLKKYKLLKITLIYVILTFLICMSFFSSIGKKNEYCSRDYLKQIDNLINQKTGEHLVYFGGSHDNPLECALYEGTINDIENSSCLCLGGLHGDFISGSTWTNDARLIGCEYGTGRLYEIDYETCDISVIGGGGIGLNSIAYDPTLDKLYGCSSNALLELNLSTGEQTYVGNFGSGPYIMIGLSCDADGELYGWDVGTDSLWTIDKDTGDAYLVGPLGINISYAQDGNFCMADDILYLAAYMGNSYLTECDKETGECTIISQFPDPSQYITILSIPWNNPPYIPSNYSPCGDVEVPFNMSWDGGDPDSGDMITYGIFLSPYDPPTLFATVGPYPANQKRIEFGPVSLPIFDTFYWRVVAWDNHGAGAVGPLCVIHTYGIIPPNEPAIEGTSKGRPGIVYDYTFVSTSPDNQTIKYYIEWGDDSINETEFLESGKPITLKHSWDDKGTYIIRAKAVDIYDQESNWSEFKINIPRNKATFIYLIFRFINEIPIIEKIQSLCS